ncbi:MAG: nucleotide exchange factor GrpE [Clostridia bacterium]|nr:nucleotide exchange factor GrpE [Clostridia bacterium]
MAKKTKDNNEAVDAQVEAAEEPETYTLTREEMEQAREHIEGLQKERDEMVELLKRTQADFDNYRKRNAQIRLDSFEDGKRECIAQLLPALDDFERMLESGDDSSNAWMEGVKLVYKKLTDALKAQGLSEIETEGKFDPSVHNAVLTEAVEGREAGEVLQVFQKGYKAGDRVIRPAMVKVSQ